MSICFFCWRDFGSKLQIIMGVFFCYCALLRKEDIVGEFSLNIRIPLYNSYKFTCNLTMLLELSLQE